MYKVLCDNALMCDPRIQELALLNPVVNLEENKAGSFSFKITPGHPFCNAIQKRKSIVEVYRDNKLIFSGMCIEASEDFYKQKSIYCEGELSYFNDSIQRPARYQNKTVRGLLETFIANHNAQVEEVKQFQVGIVTVTDPNDSLYCYTNMESTMTCLKKDLVDDLGGFFRIRHENGIKYIDYLADSQNTNSQEIRLGENLIDYTSNIDSSEIATAIIPLGAKLEESTVEGLETRLTIETVNDGCDYVHSASAVAAYGWIYQTVTWDDVTTANALKAKGEKYLAETQFENVVIEAKAIDLHLIDGNIESFKLSDKIRVVSAPHGMNKYIRLTKQTLNLNNPENDKITLGKVGKNTLSAKSNQANEDIKKAINSITPPSTILKQAKENASALINNAMGGYVVKTNSELLIMDTADTETATRVWRWNINGLGYSSTGYNGKYGLAMTMDGAIVADFITAGTMYADRIKGGALTLGGANNDNGVLRVLNSKGVEVGRWDKDGITLPENTTISWGQVTDATNQVTQITKNTVTTEFIKALNLSVGNEIKMGENAVISWGQVENIPSDLAYTDDIPTDAYITQITKDTVTTAFIKALNLSVGNEIKMGENATISWNQVTDAANQVTQITKNTVTTEFINSLRVKAGSVAAEDITGTTITGKKIIGSSIEGGCINVNNVFTVDVYGKVIASDINANGGYIGGFLIGDDHIKSDAGNVGMSTGLGGDWAFWAGLRGEDNRAVFTVGHAGEVYCKNINAYGGTIGGAQISENSISTESWSIQGDGTAYFKDVKIEGTASDSYGNFGNGLNVGNSFGITGDAYEDFKKLVVDSIEAKNVLADYITSGTVKANYMEVANWTDAGYIRAEKIKADDLFSQAITVNGYFGISGISGFCFKNINIEWGYINGVKCLVAAE